MTLTTLADVRTLIERHLPAAHRTQSTWRVVAKDFEAAAHGADPRRAFDCGAHGADAGGRRVPVDVTPPSSPGSDSAFRIREVIHSPVCSGRVRAGLMLSWAVANARQAA
jgi:hypothetical protein